VNEHVSIDGEVYDDHAARIAFFRAMVAAQKEIPLVPKTTKADRYFYATLGSVMSAVQPALNGQDIFISWRSNRPEPGLLEIECVLSHIDGWSMSVSQAGPIPQGRNGLQDLGSAQTYLQRYTLALATGVATVEDTDAAPTKATPAFDASDLTARIWAAKSVEEIDALKPEIGRLPQGDGRAAIIRAATTARSRMVEGDDA
jgi:hypothetical protein